MKIHNLTALELAQAIQSREYTAREVILHYIDRIEKYDGQLKSFITVCKEEAIKQAEEIDRKIENWEIISPLMGVPIAVKDNIITKGIKTTAASKMLEDYIPAYNATVIDKICNAGLIIIGKTNMDEFGMGASTEKSAYAICSNPHNTDMVAGGSSGGSAVCVSAGLCPIALGTDTGGSVRQPSAYCGITGYKPSYGAVSRYGLIAFASSLDQIGVMGRNTADCEALIKIISGKDKMDSTSADISFDNQEITLENLRIGVPNQFLSEHKADCIKENLLNSISKLELKGATVEFFDMPMLKYTVPIYHIISSAEASSNLAKYDGIRYGRRAENYQGVTDMYKKSRSEGFGMEVKRRILTGTFVLSKGYYDKYYGKAVTARNMLMEEFAEAFKKYDIIMGATTPDTAFKKGINDNCPVEMYLLDQFTASVNLAGLPALSIPTGYDKAGLPIGLQIIGNRFCDSRLLSTVKEIERVIGSERSDIPARFQGVQKGVNMKL